MTEATPLAAMGRMGQLRARVWPDALATHQAWRLRVAEVRASDFAGPGAVSALGGRIVRRIRQGMSVPVLGSASRPHTYEVARDRGST